MLVLTRKSNQSIVIGDDVVVTVLEVRGDHIRLGITAPRDVPVHREEVWVARAHSAAAGQVEPPAQRGSRPARTRTDSAA